MGGYSFQSLGFTVVCYVMLHFSECRGTYGTKSLLFYFSRGTFFSLVLLLINLILLLFVYPYRQLRLLPLVGSFFESIFVALARAAASMIFRIHSSTNAIE